MQNGFIGGRDYFPPLVEKVAPVRNIYSTIYVHPLYSSRKLPPPSGKCKGPFFVNQPMNIFEEIEKE